MTDRPFSARNLTATILTGYVPLVAATLVIVLPLAWMVLSSFKSSGEIVSLPVQWLPSSLGPDNYLEAGRSAPFGRFFLNSVIVTVVGASAKLILAMLTAYALVFIRFPAKKAVFTAILVALMVPAHMSLVPNYALVAGWGGRNTLWGIVVPGLGTAFGTFLLRQQLLTIPASIVEAAALDGAGHWRRMVSIVVPVSAPTIATVALISIVTEWNEYLWPLIIVDTPDLMTLPVGLTLLQNIEPGATSWGVLMAGTAFVILPVLVVFAALQRYIVSGLAQGAVTG